MEILEWLKEIMKGVEEPFVIECGCCDAYHSNKMLEIIKSKERKFIFHCFEPNKELHPQILNNLAGHLMFNTGIISVFPNAVGSENKEVTFYKSYGQKLSKEGEVLDNYYGSSSILKPKLVKESFTSMRFKEEATSVITLDRHIEKYGLQGKVIDFIWSDIQGAETALLAGGVNTFKKVKYFYTEYSNSEDYEGQGMLQDILNNLPYFEIIEDYGGDILLKNKII